MRERLVVAAIIAGGVLSALLMGSLMAEKLVVRASGLMLVATGFAAGFVFAPLWRRSTGGRINTVVATQLALVAVLAVPAATELIAGAQEGGTIVMAAAYALGSAVLLPLVLLGLPAALPSYIVTVTAAWIYGQEHPLPDQSRK